MKKPIVAIVGRTNVGKSTLFNRLAGKAVAIVEDFPGTTRDRIVADISWQDKEITLVDTGGLETKPTSPLEEKIKAQVEIAIAEADVIIFLVDVRSGLTAVDWEIADRLRLSQKSVFLVVNKVDNPKFATQVADFYQLGITPLLAISAYHGRGISELMHNVAPLLPSASPLPSKPEMMKLAIVGRPNVGKSTLLNAILGEERAIVDKVPGTTRDSLDTLFSYNSQEILLIDTAGIKRRGKAGKDIEFYSLLRALRAIERADIVLLVTDATEFITSQDAHIAGYIKEAFKGMILVVNKWDLVSSTDTLEFTQRVKQWLKFIPYVPVIYTSAKLGQGVAKLLPEALKIWRERQKLFPEHQISTLIQEAVALQPPPRVSGQELKIFSAEQKEINPPTFVLEVNNPNLVHFSYYRYLENKLRQDFGFFGTAIKLVFKKGSQEKKGLKIVR